MYAVAYRLDENCLDKDITLLSDDKVQVVFVTEDIVAIRSKSARNIVEMMTEYFVITEEEILENLYHFEPESV